MSERPHITHEAAAQDGTPRFAINGLSADDCGALFDLLREQNSRDRHLLAVAGEDESTIATINERMERLLQLQNVLAYTLQS